MHSQPIIIPPNNRITTNTTHKYHNHSITQPPNIHQYIGVWWEMEPQSARMSILGSIWWGGGGEWNQISRMSMLVDHLNVDVKNGKCVPFQIYEMEHIFRFVQLCIFNEIGFIWISNKCWCGELPLLLAGCGGRWVTAMWWVLGNVWRWGGGIVLDGGVCVITFGGYMGEMCLWINPARCSRLPASQGHIGMWGGYVALYADLVDTGGWLMCVLWWLLEAGCRLQWAVI
jgi:hypothetical protein